MINGKEGRITVYIIMHYTIIKVIQWFKINLMVIKHVKKLFIALNLLLFSQQIKLQMIKINSTTQNQMIKET